MAQNTPPKSAGAVAFTLIASWPFAGGYGYYFDAVFPKKTRHKFSAGEQCEMPELGPKCLADFVSYPKRDSWTVRFLLPKWAARTGK